MRVKDAGDFIQVEIEDNGKGIADQEIWRRFLTGSTGRIHPAILSQGRKRNRTVHREKDHRGPWRPDLGKQQAWTYGNSHVVLLLRKYQEVPVNE